MNGTAVTGGALRYDTAIYYPGGGIKSYGWNLNKDLNINGLPGTKGLSVTSDSNTICVVAYMTLNCSYHGDSIPFYATGYSTCGKLLSDSVKILPTVDSSCCNSPLACITSATEFDTIIKNTSAKHIGAPYYFGWSYKPAILVEDTFLIDTDFAFAYCNVFMAPGALIKIVKHSTLSIQVGGFIHAACEHTWRGIQVDSGSSINTNDLLVIQDADTAIYAINSSSLEALYTCNITTFNKNYADIVVSPYAGQYDGRSSACLFTCRDFDSLHTGAIPVIHPYQILGDWYNVPFDTLLPPYSGQRTSVGLTVDTVGRYVDSIGTTIFTTRGANTYDNMNLGILSYASDLNIYTDLFQNINTNDISLAGIAAYGSDSLAKGNILNVGGPGRIKNTFKNCTAAVLAFEGFQTINISHNKIHCDTNTTYGQYGIITFGPMNLLSSMTIDSNLIDSAEDAIVCVMSSSTIAHIDSNTITGADWCYNDAGILLEEFASPFATYNVENNNIKNVYMGIYTNDVDSATIYRNRIFMSDSLCSQGIGISVNGDIDDQIVANTISMTKHSTSTPYISDNMLGIYAGNSQNCFISCDSTFYLNVGIDCDGVGSTGLYFDVWGNQMTAGPNTLNSIGIALTNGSLIGQQGTLGAPSDNQWLDPTNFMCNSTVPLPTIPSASPFYVHTGTTFDPISSGCSPQIDTVNTSGTFYSCTNAPPIIISRTMLANIATNKISYLQKPDTSARLAKLAAMRSLWKNENLLNTPLFRNFNDSLNTTSSGEIMAIDSSINSKLHYNPITLLSKLNLITPANNIEANMQYAAQAHLQAKISKQKTLSQSQLSPLVVLANKCPNYDGHSVYEARTFNSYYGGCFKVYDDNGCTNDNNRHHSEKHNVTILKDSNNNFSFNLFPNPNNGYFTLIYNLGSEKSGRLEIYNQVGINIAEYLLTSDSGNIQINNKNLSEGIYIYKLYTNTVIRKVGKIVIIR